MSVAPLCSHRSSKDGFDTEFTTTVYRSYLSYDNCYKTEFSLTVIFSSAHSQPLNTLFLHLFVAQQNFAPASVKEILR